MPIAFPTAALQRRQWLGVGAWACLVLLLAPVAQAESPVGKLVKLRLPVEGNADRVFQGVLERAAGRLKQAPRPDGAGRPVLIIELTGDSESGSSEFERCLALSRFIRQELTGCKTVAYLPQTLKGHAVLVALACEEIAMAPGAEIGDAAAGEDPSRAIEPGMAAVYKEMAESRSNYPAIALGMVDRRVEVLKVEDETGVDFLLRKDLVKLREDRAIVGTDILSAAGSTLLLTGREARDIAFVKYLAANRQALARVLGLPAEAVKEDQSIVAEWKPTIIEINGAITPRLTKQVTTLIGNEISQRKVNWIGFRINSGGGSMARCVELASVIAELDPNEVRTVAYVPAEAAGGAALVALACDQLIMHSGAKIGGGLKLVEAAERPGRRLPLPGARQVPGEPPPRPDNELTRSQLDATLGAVRESLAQTSERSWSLLAAVLDPAIRVYQYTHQKTGEEALFSEEQLAEQPDAAQWRQGEELTQADEVLVLTSDAAKRFGVAFQVLEGYDELKQLYGFTEDLPVAKPNWALELVEALANPWLAGMLLLVGFAGIYIELNSPGLGIGAFVGSVALLLFFWSHFLSGTAEWLEVILFLAGVFFILMEVFVLPGFGIFGLGGTAMVLASLVLASQTFVIPKTAGQMGELRQSLTVVVLSITGCLILGAVFRRYLPHAPGFRRMMLVPADAAELAELDHRESLADYAHLVGRTGEATTNLRPSGKAEIDGELVDVIAEGGIVERGDPILVVSAKGARVVVRRA